MLAATLLLFAPLGWVMYSSKQSRKPTGLLLPRILHEEEAANTECRWLRLKRIKYVDHVGVQRVWEKAERRHDDDSSFSFPRSDGVMIVCRIRGGEWDGCVPFVKQFRPNVGGFTLELPAGLVDKGETCEQAAVRELQEECGFVGGTVRHTSPPLSLDPGMSGSCATFVLVDVDGTVLANTRPAQRLDEGEHCEVIYIKQPTVDAINRTAREHGALVDANTYYAVAVLTM